MAQDILLPGFAGAGSIDTWMLWLKVMATGAGMALLLLLVVFTAALYRHRDTAAPVSLHFTLANLFITAYLASDTLVRIHVALDRVESTLIPYRVALSAIVLAVGAYANFYWSLAGKRPVPRGRLSATYAAAAALAVLPWVEHPLLLVADTEITRRGASVFVDYGAAAPLFFGLCLALFAAISYKVLRLAARIEDGAAWGLTVFGFVVFFLAGLHDTLREMGVTLLPVNVLALGCAGFQIGAFGVMAMHYSRTLGERARQVVQLRRLADEVTRDTLSGLYNRAYLEHRLDRLGDDARGGLLFIDLDHFKDINDRHGHWYGDRLIRAAAERIRTNIRGEDIACRWGGDEFVVYLADVDAETARPLVNRLASALNGMGIEDLPDIELRTSMGFAVLADGDWRTTLNRADQALYEAKRAGRNRLRIA